MIFYDICNKKLSVITGSSGLLILDLGAIDVFELS